MVDSDPLFDAVGKALRVKIDFNCCCTRFAQPSHSDTLWVHDRQTKRYTADDGRVMERLADVRRDCP